jgi:hypothetical protein
VSENPDPLDEARRLMERASPGRWGVMTPDGVMRIYAHDPATGHPVEHVATVGGEEHAECRGNAALIAAAPALLAALMAELSAAREVVEAARYDQEHDFDCPARSADSCARCRCEVSRTAMGAALARYDAREASK